MAEVRVRPTEVVLATDAGEEVSLPRNAAESCAEAARRITRVVRVDRVLYEDPVSRWSLEIWPVGTPWTRTSTAMAHTSGPSLSPSGAVA